MCLSSEEGLTDGLGIFNTRVNLFPPREIVPHMGWNSLSTSSSSLLKGIKKEDDFYFVHSYYADVCQNTSATCDYILPFSAILEYNNFYATQFHPEKSGDTGDMLLQNFLEL